jgi:hypothetical protein
MTGECAPLSRGIARERRWRGGSLAPSEKLSQRNSTRRRDLQSQQLAQRRAESDSATTVHGGDESDNRATTAGIKPLDSVSVVTHNGQKLAVGLGSARTTKATIPFPRGRLRGRGDTAGKKRPSLVCACPPWHEGQAGRWRGPCPDAPKGAAGGIPAVSPRRTGCTVQADTASERTPNTPHPLRGRRIAHEPGIASPDPIWQARSCQRGHGTGPLSHAGILALRAGRMSSTTVSVSDAEHTMASPWASVVERVATDRRRSFERRPSGEYE